MHQVTTVEEAVRAAENGVDIIVAQGSESGGYSGHVSTMVLVPQVVDAVRPLPVVAAGGIFDGRGLAAALMLGAVGVNMGTRFLASDESPITAGHKQAINGAASQDAVHFGALNDIFPQWIAGGYNVVMRTIHTPFTDEWETKRSEIEGKRSELQNHLLSHVSAGRGHEVLPVELNVGDELEDETRGPDRHRYHDRSRSSPSFVLNVSACNVPCMKYAYLEFCTFVRRGSI